MPKVLCTLYEDPSAGQLGVTKTLKLGEDVENHIRRAIHVLKSTTCPNSLRYLLSMLRPVTPYKGSQ